MAIVATWTDYRDRTVELTDNGWAHILDRHEDMVGRLNLVGAAIHAPVLVVRDPTIHRLEHLYGAVSGELRVHVVVIYRPTPHGWVGTIRTAHLTDRTKKGERLWP